MKFNFRSLTHEVAIHVPTSQQRRNLMEWCKQNGAFEDDDFPCEEILRTCDVRVDLQEKTCFSLNNKDWKGYCYEGFYISCGDEIIEYSDYEWPVKEKFDICNYPGRYVMHCDTEEKAVAFTRYMDSVGLEWINNRSYIDQTQWEVYKQDTCYDFNEGQFCNIGYFLEENDDANYTILEFDDFDWARTFTDAIMFDDAILEDLILCAF